MHNRSVPVRWAVIGCLALSLPSMALGEEEAPDLQRPTPHYPEDADETEREALDRLAAELRGAAYYTRKGHIRRVVIGDWREFDLGEGEHVRCGPEGRHLAVFHKRKVYLADAVTGERKKVVAEKADKARNGCPIEFHPNGREIVYLDGGRFHAVDIETGEVRKLNAPGKYRGAPCVSADGTRMAARSGHNLYAIDLESGRHIKYARGCSPGISPNGKALMNNVGGHNKLIIRPWDGSDKKTLDADTCKPDRKWDNHHWSNHDDYVTAQGEDRGGYSYVVRVSTGRGTRITWEGDTHYPDLWVAPERPAEDDAPQVEDEAGSEEPESADGAETERAPAEEH